MAPLDLLRDRRLLRVWVTGGLIGTMRWLEILMIAVYTLEVTGSALAVALMMLARALPMFLFGAITGAIAERINRKAMMIFALFGAGAVSATLGGLAVAGRIEIWHIGLGAFLAGMLWTLEFPVRRTMLGEIAGRHGVGAAMSLDSATTNGTRMLGPALGGLLFEPVGLPGAYWLGAVLYGLGGAAILSLDYVSSAAPARDESLFSSIAVGLRYIRGNRPMVGMLAVTVIMNLWAFPFAAMVPVIGRDVLDISALPIGVLLSAEGAGAFVGALIIAALVRPARFNLIYLSGSFLLLASIIVFSFSSLYAVSLAVLFIAGLGAAGFSAMQTAIMFTLAPPEMRGRILGVLAFCIGASPIGLLNAGWLAEWLGPSQAIAVLAGGGLVAMALVCFYWRDVWSLRGRERIFG